MNQFFYQKNFQVQHFFKKLKIFVIKIKLILTISEENEISKYSNTGKHQGIIANLVADGYFSEAKFWDVLDSLTKLNILILDGIQDPHNFGSISRSALAFGIEYIFIPKKDL